MNNFWNPWSLVWLGVGLVLGALVQRLFDQKPRRCKWDQR